MLALRSQKTKLQQVCLLLGCFFSCLFSKYLWKQQPPPPGNYYLGLLIIHRRAIRLFIVNHIYTRIVFLVGGLTELDHPVLHPCLAAGSAFGGIDLMPEGLGNLMHEDMRRRHKVVDVGGGTLLQAKFGLSPRLPWSLDLFPGAPQLALLFSFFFVVAGEARTVHEFLRGDAATARKFIHIKDNIK